MPRKTAPCPSAAKRSNLKLPPNAKPAREKKRAAPTSPTSAAPRPPSRKPAPMTSTSLHQRAQPSRREARVIIINLFSIQQPYDSFICTQSAFTLFSLPIVSAPKSSARPSSQPSSQVWTPSASLSSSLVQPHQTPTSSGLHDRTRAKASHVVQVHFLLKPTATTLSRHRAASQTRPQRQLQQTRLSPRGTTPPSQSSAARAAKRRPSSASTVFIRK